MVMAAASIDQYASVHLTKNTAFLKRVHGVFNEAHNPQSEATVSPRDLIGQALRQRVESVNHDSCEPGDEDTFFVADLGEVYRQHMRWKLNLPRVKPFYAVKCNPDAKVLQLLASLGTGFDCASKAEIDQVLDMGVAPERIIYAQPCKTTSYVRYVASRGVSQMTFDNADELRKIARLYPDADLFLRIATDDSASLCRLSLKFGAAVEDADSLLALAAELGLRVVGVSFHVGSGASDPLAFLKAVRDANTVFSLAEAHGFHLGTLDVGGGFCADSSFEAMAGVLRSALDDYFPPHRGVALIAEPGRFYVSSAFTIACNVIARRTVQNSDSAPSGNDTSYMLYVNDGLYGNFSSIMFDHQQPVAKVLRVGNAVLYNTEAAEPLPSLPVAAATVVPAITLSSASSLSCASLISDAVSEENTDVFGDGALTPDMTDDYVVTGRRPVNSGTAGIEYSIWGPTCDGIDRITESTRFEALLDVGDWLYFEDMGAYTKCSATRFNGFSDSHDVIYVCSEPGASALLAAGSHGLKH